MILVQSSCRCSVFLMCRMKRHNVLAAASFTGNTMSYCWRKQWRRGGGINVPRQKRLLVHTPPRFSVTHYVSVGRILRTKLDHVHKMALTHTLCYVEVQVVILIVHISTDALEGEGYELGVELVGGHAVDEEGEVFQ